MSGAYSLSACARAREPFLACGPVATCGGSSPTQSRLKQGLDSTPLVHRLVAIRCLVEREGQVEDLAGVDPPVPDEVDQPGQEPAHRCRAAVQVHVREEQFVAGQLDVMGDTHVPGLYEEEETIQSRLLDRAHT
jgi:hypothetical protein